MAMYDMGTVIHFLQHLPSRLWVVRVIQLCIWIKSKGSLLAKRFIGLRVVLPVRCSTTFMFYCLLFDWLPRVSHSNLLRVLRRTHIHSWEVELYVDIVHSTKEISDSLRQHECKSRSRKRMASPDHETVHTPRESKRRKKGTILLTVTLHMKLKIRKVVSYCLQPSKTFILFNLKNTGYLDLFSTT